MVRIVNGEVVNESDPRYYQPTPLAPLTAANSNDYGIPALHASPAPTVNATDSSCCGAAASVAATHDASPTYSAAAALPSPISLPPSYHNPYLTAFGDPTLTSGHGLHAPSPPADTHMQLQQQQQMHQHFPHAYYFPHHAYYGFTGTGFILGPPQQYSPPPTHVLQQEQRQQQAQQQSLQQHVPTTAGAATMTSSPNATAATRTRDVWTQTAEADYAHVTDSANAVTTTIDSALPHSSSSSAITSAASTPSFGPSSSPLLAATSARRRSKAHVQFIPVTHSVAAGGMVVPVNHKLSQPASQLQPQQGALKRPPSTRARVAKAFALFDLPPVYVYEIRVLPHVYLLAALIVYLIGPPALIPLVASFFYFRWYTQSQAAMQRARGEDWSTNIHAGKAGGRMTAEMGADTPHKPLQPQPTLPLPVPPPTTRPRRNSNIHSLADLPETS